MASYKGQKNIDKASAFWSKVDIKKNWECWPYKEYLDDDGYGRFHYINGPIGAHVYAWLLTVKLETVPEGKLVRHLCHKRSCCNPSHLICGTVLDNIRDKIKSGRSPNPRSLSHPALYSGEIWLIRRLLATEKFSQVFISKMFKVDQGTVSHINTSDRWPCKEGDYA